MDTKTAFPRIGTVTYTPAISRTMLVDVFLMLTGKKIFRARTMEELF